MQPPPGGVSNRRLQTESQGPYTLLVIGVAADGKGQGLWAPPHQTLRPADIVVEASRVQISAQNEPVAVLEWAGEDLLAPVGVPGKAEALPSRFERRKPQLTLVYVTAPDCTFCRQFEAWEKKPFLASPVGHAVDFRQVNARSSNNTGEERDWPDDLRWILKATNTKKGAPRFIVVMDRQVIRNELGLVKWGEEIRPMLRRLTGVSGE